MQAIIQTVMGMLGAIGFSILFNVRGKKLMGIAAGAGISWVVYLAVYQLDQDKVVSLVFATIAAAVISEIMARLIKIPVTITLVPILIPLIPGSDLFYATSNMVRGRAEESTYYLELVLKESGAIDFGIILVTCVVQVINKVMKKIMMRRGSQHTENNV